MRTLDPTTFDSVTFDCYGTLIDGESGTLADLRRLGCRLTAPFRSGNHGHGSLSRAGVSSVAPWPVSSPTY